MSTIDDKWDEAFEKGEVDIGDMVVCDWCGEDYTHRSDVGGLLFGSKATCPKCMLGIEASALNHGELAHIKARCPSDQSFADWVRELRGGNNTIRVTRYGP